MADLQEEVALREYLDKDQALLQRETRQLEKELADLEQRVLRARRSTEDQRAELELGE